MVGILPEEEQEVEKRRSSGGRREQEGVRRGLEGKGNEGAVLGLWRERPGTGRKEVLAVEKKLVAMAELSRGLSEEKLYKEIAMPQPTVLYGVARKQIRSCLFGFAKNSIETKHDTQR